MPYVGMEPKFGYSLLAICAIKYIKGLLFANKSNIHSQKILNTKCFYKDYIVYVSFTGTGKVYIHMSSLKSIFVPFKYLI